MLKSNTCSPLDCLNSPVRYPRNSGANPSTHWTRPGPGEESRQKDSKGNVAGARRQGGGATVAWQACPRVTLVTPASNRLKGSKAGDTAGRETGVGARQRGIKLLSGDARPGVEKGRRVPGLPRPHAGTSSCGSRRFGLRRTEILPGRTEGAGQAEGAAESGRDAHPPAKR